MEKTSEIAHDFSPFFKVHKDGYVERCIPLLKIPPTNNPNTGVRCKDVIISVQPDTSARIFLPQMPKPNSKLPVLVYFHGGGFSLRSAFEPVYHDLVASLVNEASCIAISVEYRLAPEQPIPACYDDSWTALQWVASHANGKGPDQWLNKHGDLGRVFIAGDSAGANISYNMGVRVGLLGLPKVKIEGMILVHPFFMGSYLDRIWLYMCPENRGLDDPRLKPAAEDLGRIGCDRVLVFTASKDKLKNAGRSFCKELKNSEWKGYLETVENEGVGHVFHLFKPNSDQALILKKSCVSFINQEPKTWRSKI